MIYMYVNGHIKLSEYLKSVGDILLNSSDITVSETCISEFEDFFLNNSVK